MNKVWKAFSNLLVPFMMEAETRMFLLWKMTSWRRYGRGCLGTTLCGSRRSFCRPGVSWVESKLRILRSSWIPRMSSNSWKYYWTRTSQTKNRLSFSWSTIKDSAIWDKMTMITKSRTNDSSPKTSKTSSSQVSSPNSYPLKTSKVK